MGKVLTHLLSACVRVSSTYVKAELCVGAGRGEYVLVTTDAQESQKRTSDSLDLELVVDAGNPIQHLQEQYVWLSHLSSPSRYRVCTELSDASGKKIENLSEISHVCWFHSGAHRLPTPLRGTQRRFLLLGEKP